MGIILDMKILSLNTWCGREFNPLIEYLKKHDGEIDAFCLQEVFDSQDLLETSPDIRSNLWSEICKLFPDYYHFFQPVMKDTDNQGEKVKGLLFGLGIIIKKTFLVEKEGDFFVYRNRFADTSSDPTSIPVNVQFITIKIGTSLVTICHIQGKWFPGDKLDTHERIEQSKRILEFLDNHKGPKVLCGDFNLLPGTQSIKMIEEKMKNLVKDYGIQTTRSRLNTYYGTSSFQKFADYVFVSPDVQVQNFTVPDIQVSDHLPLILEFEILR